MARKRMFSLDIIDTDIFLEMPQSSRLLYYELCMRADDDGFVSSPKKIIKTVGCSDDDFKVLIAKQFIIPFESGVIVIKHWRIHNTIRSDRSKETIHTEEKNQLILEENRAYGLRYTNGCHLVAVDKNRIEENRVEEDSVSTTTDNLISGRNGNGDENSNKESERDGNRKENLFEFVERVFGRTISPIEYEVINTWEDSEITRYAVEQADLARAHTTKYVESILRAYKDNGIKTLEDAKERDKKFQEKRNGKKEIIKPKSKYEVGKVYEIDGIKFKLNQDGKREIL